MMKQVAKILIRDANDMYLVLRRSNHPAFPFDIDLPGGTLDGKEQPLDTVLREIEEEVGFSLTESQAELVHQSTQYKAGYLYYLYSGTVTTQPEVSISWEHSSFDWMHIDEIISEAKTAADTYMHMVHDYLVQNITKKVI